MSCYSCEKTNALASKLSRCSSETSGRNRNDACGQTKIRHQLVLILQDTLTAISHISPPHLSMNHTSSLEAAHRGSVFPENTTGNRHTEAGCKFRQHKTAARRRYRQVCYWVRCSHRKRQGGTPQRHSKVVSKHFYLVSFGFSLSFSI